MALSLELVTAQALECQFPAELGKLNCSRGTAASTWENYGQAHREPLLSQVTAPVLETILIKRYFD